MNDCELNEGKCSLNPIDPYLLADEGLFNNGHSLRGNISSHYFMRYIIPVTFLDCLSWIQLSNVTKLSAGTKVDIIVNAPQKRLDRSYCEGSTGRCSRSSKQPPGGLKWACARTYKSFTWCCHEFYFVHIYFNYLLCLESTFEHNTQTEKRARGMSVVAWV
jgi:hypothetical protein